MKIQIKWIETKNSQVTCCAIDPLHDIIAIGNGKTIYLMNIITKQEITKCEKHQSDVTSLSFRKDGQILASGGKDNIVYLWSMSSLGKPINKIVLIDPIIQVNFNPCMYTLINLSKTQLGLFRDGEKKKIDKQPLSNTAVQTAWTNDGLQFAIGFENGMISIRDNENDSEIKSLTLSNGEERIWCLTFSNSKHYKQSYTLFVGTWEKNIYIIETFNYSIIDVKKVNYDPICINLFKDDYFMVGSNSNEINMFTKEGIYVTSINEAINSWILCLKSDSKHDSIIACTQEGKIINFNLIFQTVHSIHEENYVYRSKLMDVVVFNLISKVKIRLIVKKFISKLAIYKSRIAVMLKSNIFIYDIYEKGEDEDEIFNPFYSITWEGECSLLLITYNHLVICFENRIQLIPMTSLNGTSEREWIFEANVSYLKVIGGPKNRESLLCGLFSGEVYIISIDNQFPILIYSHPLSIKILDISCGRKKLAIIDEDSNLTVIDVKSKEIIISDEKAKSIAFNSDIEDIISYWNDGNVYIKTENFPSNIEKMSGIIVGYQGTKIFLLQGQNNVNILDTSQSTSIIRYSEQGNFQKAYKLASIGATKEEWLFLGFEALVNLDLKIALKCFQKLEDMRLINLVTKVEGDIKSNISEDVIKGEIKCFKGDYQGAEDSFIKGNQVERAIEMWTMLSMFDKALDLKKKYGNSTDDNKMDDKLLLQQAEWLLETGKYLEAADIFMILNKKKRVIDIYGEHGYLDKLIDVMRPLDKQEHSDMIIACGGYFKKHKHYQYATEAYLKLDDLKSLVIMNIELEKWDEAFYLAKQNNNLLQYCHLQWADNRIKKDLYREAQDSYKKAGRIDLSMKLLENLIDNAIYEKRFKDGASLLTVYSLDSEALIKDFRGLTKSDLQLVRIYQEINDIVDILNAYDMIYKYIEEPFSPDLLSTDSTWIFNGCKFLLNKMTNYKFTLPFIKSLSFSYIYYACAFLSKQNDANKTSRFCFEKLNDLNIPKAWKSKIEFEIMTIRAKAYTDNESQLSLCFKCLSSNPILNLNDDKCTLCGNIFIRSQISYEILPLVEFKLPSHIVDNKAKELISLSASKSLLSNQIVERKDSQGERVIYYNSGNEGKGESDGNEDLFENALIEWCDINTGKNEYGDFYINEDILSAMKESEVFILDNQKKCESQPIRYFKNRMKDIFIVMCHICFRFFRMEEWENYSSKNNSKCPVCNDNI